MKTRDEKLAAIEVAMTRWIRRQGRAATALARLQKQKQRLLKPRDPMRVGKMSPAMAKALEVADQIAAKDVPAELERTSVKPLEHHDDLAHMPSNIVRPRGHARLAHLAEDMGQALRESSEDAELPKFLDRRDPLIAEQMTAARKKAEAEERKKMPLTGRAAEAAVRSKTVRQKSVKA